MTVWTQVADAHGATGRVPMLLDQVEYAETPEAWQELWDRLCLHGEAVSPASFAALPRLALLASRSAQALELAGTIVGGALRHPDDEVLLAGCAAALARLRELADQRLPPGVSRPARPARQYHWSAALEDFTDDFYTVSCPHCDVAVAVAVGDLGRYSAIRDWDRGDIGRRALRPAPPGELTDPGDGCMPRRPATGGLS